MYTRLLAFFATSIIAPSLLCVGQDHCTAISGEIIDEDGLPLPGAHIYNLTSKAGAVSNQNGIFSVKCNPSDTLNFSYIGYDSVVVYVAQLNRCHSLVIQFDKTKLLPELTIYGLPPSILERKERKPYPLKGINAQPQNIHKYDKPVFQLLSARDEAEAEQIYKDVHQDPNRIATIGPGANLSGALTHLLNPLSNEFRQEQKLEEENALSSYFELVEEKNFQRSFLEYHNTDTITYRKYVIYFRDHIYHEKKHSTDYALSKAFYDSFPKFRRKE